MTSDIKNTIYNAYFQSFDRDNKATESSALTIKDAASAVELLELHSLFSKLQDVFKKYPDVNSVKIGYVKKEYDDEGLHEGIYWDYTLKNGKTKIGFIENYEWDASPEDTVQMSMKFPNVENYVDDESAHGWNDAQVALVEKNAGFGQELSEAFDSAYTDYEKAYQLAESLYNKPIRTDKDIFEQLKSVAAPQDVDAFKAQWEQREINTAVDIVLATKPSKMKKSTKPKAI